MYLQSLLLVKSEKKTGKERIRKEERNDKKTSKEKPGMEKENISKRNEKKR
jgi:hypothetical protein